MVIKAKRLLNSNWKKIGIALLVVAMLSLTSIFCFSAYASAEKEVILVQNGTVKKVATRANTVQELLKEYHIKMHAHDSLQPGPETALKDNMAVEVKTAKRITLTNDGTSQKVWSTEGTVGEMLASQGVRLSEHDVAVPEVNTELKSGMNVTIQRGFQVKLVDGTDEPKRIWTLAMPVSDFLKTHNINLDENDKVKTNNGQDLLQEGSEIHIIRVNSETTTEYAPIDYKTIKRQDPALEKGKIRVIQEGREGKMAKHYKITRENGKETVRHLIQSDVIDQAKDKIIAVGTKPVPRQMTDQHSQQRGKVLFLRSSAYTSNCKGCSGITTTGFNLKTHTNAKIIAVDPSVIPLGSRVYVEGYGYATALDTGGAIKGNRIDIFFPSIAQANNWGVRTVKVTVLD
ncbi:ubiquitin-like domain-containing protein [Camelliibacillus cellulosilyticus]|uniref:Ubiquitin-like domain-containing protein n=1 Tax=Camelliibacillus cellulosilyticus TaxID=2174486 RepID=A0ABV9GQR8_9BACL